MVLLGELEWAALYFFFLSSLLARWHIRRFAKIASISDKMREARLRWLGYVMKRDEDNILKSVYQARVEGTRSRGRQRLRWKDKMERDMKGMELRTGMWLDRGE